MGDPVVVEAQQRVSSLLLRAAYFGALRLALEKFTGVRRKVFLMPLGGGVFRNSQAAIARAISEAVELAADLCGGQEELNKRLDVRLLAWEGNPAECAAFSSQLAKL